MEVESVPTLSLDEESLPQIRGWKVGSQYGVYLSLEMISLSKDPYDTPGDKEDTPNELRASFKIVGVKPVALRKGVKLDDVLDND